MNLGYNPGLDSFRFTALPHRWNQYNENPPGIRITGKYSPCKI